MKKTKIALIFTVFVFIGLSLSSCAKCKNEDPRGRIQNNGTEVANVQIKTSGGNTENINNVMPGTTSDFRFYAPGVTTFTITVDKNDYIKTVEMEECFEYDIVIDANNNITTVPVDRNE